MPLWSLEPRDGPHRQNDLQLTAFSSISPDYQENSHLIPMPINDKGKVSLSNPPPRCKNKVIICPKWGGKGYLYNWLS